MHGLLSSIKVPTCDEEVSYKQMGDDTKSTLRVTFWRGLRLMLLGGVLGGIIGYQTNGNSKQHTVKTVQLIGHQIDGNPAQYTLSTVQLSSGNTILPDCGVAPEFCAEPLAKKTVRKMDAHLMARNGMDTKEEFMTAHRPFWAHNFLYTSVGFGNFRGLAGWYTGEYLTYNALFPKTVFTQMIFAGEKSTATTTTYGRTHWMGSFRGIDGAGAPITIRITDFYQVNADGRITYNFMMMDWADMLRQLGRPVLPPAKLHEGFVQPPVVMNGVPAPISQFADRTAAERCRGIVKGLLHRDLVEQSLNVTDWHPRATWYGPVGIGLARGSSEYRDHFIKLLRSSMKDPVLTLKVLTCEDTICGAHGVLYGNHTGTLFGLQPTGKRLGLTYGMHYRLDGDKVVEGWAIFDLPGLWEQVGLDMFEIAAAQAPRAGAVQPPPPPSSFRF